MTTDNSNSNEQDKKTLMIDDERGLIALDASYEIEGLTLLIQKELKDAPECELLALRGIAIRIKELNSIIMSAIGDELESTQELAHRIC